MGWTSTKRGSSRQKIVVGLKTSIIVIVIICLITPLRNVLMPEMLWYSPWNDVSSLKLLRIHLSDLFYYIDRSPYTGPCDVIHRQLTSLPDIRPDNLRVYTEQDWQAGLDNLQNWLSAEDVWKVQHFRPSLSAEEQRELLYSVLVMTRAFDIFNITYFMAEGSLIGLQRHHGLIPWDDDVDVTIKASQWRLARQVLSCIPDFSLSMGRDFMWKFMWNKSKLWQGESFIRFPYVDVFPYNEDTEHLWPLTIWMKREIIWRREHVYPPRRLPLEGQLVSVPANTPAILVPTYGSETDEVCASRIFNRKKRELFAMSERVRVPCSYLYGIYPFVFHVKDRQDGSSVQLRKMGTKVLSSFKPH